LFFFLLSKTSSLYTPLSPKKSQKNRVFRGALLLLVGGCAQISDHLTVNPDGSGTVELTVTPLVKTDSLLMMRQMSQAEQMPKALFYPPLNEQEAKKLFPKGDFSVQTEEQEKDGKKTFVVKVEFKDVNKLLSSPYGTAHNLWVGLDPDGKQLRFKATSGFSYLSAADGLKGKPQRMLVPLDVDEILKVRDKFSMSFTLTLPGAATATEAEGKVQGNSATWTISAEKEPAKPAAALSAVMTAACPAEAAKFKVRAPIRLGLGKFDDLKEGPTGEVAVKVDEAKVKTAAKFSPVMLSVTRNFDLSGEGGFDAQNQTEMIGMITLPKEIAPANWGEVKLLEVKDDQGTDLLFNDPDEDGMRTHYRRSRMRGSEGAGGGKADPAAGELRRFVNFTFKSPEAKAKKISAIKGQLPLHYPGAGQIVKIKDAIAQKDIMDESQMRLGRINNKERALAHPKFKELGVKIEVSQVMRTSGRTTVMLQVSGQGTSLVSAQVFDAQGQPWSVVSSSDGNSHGETKWVQMMVVGQPEGPLSLAFLLIGGGATVNLPIELTDVPIEPNQLNRPDDGDDEDDDEDDDELDLEDLD
jgi:hypothetical protein